ncbi:purine and uridine phosphorylase, partial [Aureobasidium melanogenum]
MSVGQVSTPSTREGYSSEDYEIGIICALPIELAAVLGMLDEEHPRLPQNPNDSNLYYLGRTGDHNIVITCLPAGRIGLVSAARVAMQMQISFACIQKGLMVGIGGGVPSEQHDIRLGDIVVSQPTGQYGGVVQYDFGKTHPGGVFERTGSLCPPPDVLLAALNGVKVSQLTNRFSIAAHLSSLAERLPDYKFPSQLSDDLYHPDHLHKGGQSCCGCGTENRIRREPRSNRLLPVVHYGTIASGDRVMKDAIERDKISQSLGGILCFEMEAAALMNNFRCLVIRGISDYSDSHKNDGWQKYAAAVAAAYAKELLNHLPPAQPTLIHSIPQDADSLHQRLNRTTDQEILNWLSSSRVAMIQSMTRNDRVKNSGEWLLHDSRYKDWFYSGGLIWLHGIPGCGKSVLSSKIIDDLTERYKSDSNFRVVYCAGAEIIYVLLIEDLASITITEELVQAAVHNKLNPGVIEVLVKIRAHEIPISFLTLLAIGRRSTLALQSLVNSPGYMELDMDPILTQPECFYATKELIDLGLQIPLDTTLIKILAGSPNGTQMMKLILETQVMEHPLTALDAIIVAKNFDLETLDLLLKHGKNDEDFVRAWKEARAVVYAV